MKTLQEIKDEYAKENGHDSFNDMCVCCYGAYVSDHIDEIANRHAIEVAKQALINASENVFHESDARRIIHESNIPEL